MPLVSIIIPVHNAAGTLDRALNSLAKQTLDDIEIVAVNDNSTDDSGAILKRRQRSEPRLRVLTLPENAGTLTARKRAIEQAAGKYLLFLDPDDTLAPESAEFLVQTAEQGNYHIVEFGSNDYLPNPDGSFRRAFGYLTPQNRSVRGESAVFEDFFRDGMQQGNLCFKMIRRELCLQAAREVDDEYCIVGEDLYFYTIASYYAPNYRSVAKRFYNYYVESGITAAKRPVSKNRFLRMASVMTALSGIENFLERKKLLHDPQWRTVWHRRRDHQISRLLAVLQTQVPRQDRADAARELLVRYGENNELACRLRQAESQHYCMKTSRLQQLLQWLLPLYSRRRYWMRKWMRAVRGKGI